MRRRFMANLT
jgi:hypothetical protein